MASNADICSHLSRPDKWFLGGPGRLTWTPPHPQWLEIPGFWDEAHYYDFSLAPLFTMTLLDEDGRPLSLDMQERNWQPDRLQQRYATDGDLTLTERRTWHPSDALLASYAIENTSSTPQTVHLVAWSMRTIGPSESIDVRREDSQLQFKEHLHKEDRPPRELACAFDLNRSIDSYSVTLSESGPVMPRWAYTPFYESFANGRLDNAYLTGNAHPEGVLYLAFHTELTVPDGQTEDVTLGFTAAPNFEESTNQLNEALHEDAPRVSTASWEQYFDDLPAFSCSDPFFERYYWYRWYGLRLFTAQPDAGTNYHHPAVFEGLGYFRKLITYSAQCHMLETRWMPDASIAQGSLLNFIENQRSDGGFFGHLFPQDAQENSFYHANWGHAWKVHQNHPDTEFLESAYAGLKTYLNYFDRERDPEGSGLYDIHNHYETGQEYMHRYVAVSSSADKVHWGRIFRLKGVDAAVQIYQTKRAMAKMARHLDRDNEATRWDTEAVMTREAVREQMWDPDAEMFFDVDPESGKRTGVKATICFYPYFTDIVEEKHLSGLKRHLLNPDEFWTPHPAPSSSRDDAYFSARPYWKNKRMNCPWNGRVWPMTNSHVAEALAQAALRFDDDELRQKAAAFITRYIRMLFDDGDPERPNCFEHYNPFTGQPCRYRGVDDYQHSWIVELVIKYVCGLRPGDEEVTVDPFPFDLDRFCIENVPVRGKRLGVERDGQDVQATVNDEPAGTSTLGHPLRLSV